MCCCIEIPCIVLQTSKLARRDNEGIGLSGYEQCYSYKSTHFWDHSTFMPDFCEKAVSISCCDAVSVGTGLEDGVGAGATKARRISSVVAIRMKSWSLTMHRLSHRKTPVENSELNFHNLIFGHFFPVATLTFFEYYTFCGVVIYILACVLILP